MKILFKAVVLLATGWSAEEEAEVLLVDPNTVRAHFKRYREDGKAVGHWAKETFGVSYTESGMTAVLHRLGYVYKKPRLVPGKADREAQEQFLETYDNIRNTKGQNDPIIFMDATQSTPTRRLRCSNNWKRFTSLRFAFTSFVTMHLTIVPKPFKRT